jgi:hypothetical protein
MKLIVAGGRDFTDNELLYKKLDKLLESLPITEIVAGGATGADRLGVEWAIERGVTFKEFNADWRHHGKKAGPIRNRQMAEYADSLIAFWDGQSRGTKHMIQYMKYEMKKPHAVVMYNVKNSLLG